MRYRDDHPGSGRSSIIDDIGNIAGVIMPFVALYFFDKFSLAGVLMMVAVMYALLIIAARFSPETKGRSRPATPAPVTGALCRKDMSCST